LIVNSCAIHFPGYGARAERGAIRWELFLDWNIRDVLHTERADTLQIIFNGAADPDAWTRLLTDAGCPKPSFGSVQPTPTGEPLAA
jgi:hypothetical protein